MRRAIFIFLLMASYQSALSANISVSGRVTSVDQTPVGGANVLLKGTAIGTTTDMNGYFQLNLPEGEILLIFSFLKAKPLEHAISLQHGFKYHVNVSLARKTQTFNMSTAATSTLPEDAPVVLGRVLNHESLPVAGASITQSSSGFETTSDASGNFVLPVAEGTIIMSFSFTGSKTLKFDLQLQRGDRCNLEVTLVDDKPKLRHLSSHARLLGRGLSQ